MMHKGYFATAEFLKAFTNPLRVRIIAVLKNGNEASVTDIIIRTGGKQSHVSQQLKILSRKKIVLRRPQAQTVYYSLRNRKFADLLGLVEQDMIENEKLKVEPANVEMASIQSRDFRYSFV